MRALMPALIGALLVIGGCRDAAGPAPGLEEVAELAVMVDLASVPTVAQVRLLVTGAEIPDTLRFALPVVNGEARGTATVPVGSQRRFVLQALDAAQVVRYEGFAVADVIPGSNPPLMIVMMPVDPVGEVPIIGVLGTYAITLTPATAVLDVGQRITIGAVVRDPSGAVISGAVPTWQSTDTTVAAVDAMGVVTARAIGSTTIHARYADALASTSIQVVSVAPSAAETLFVDGFESGTLNDPGRWPDLLRNGASMISASTAGISAVTGTRVLRIGPNGVAMTHFVSTGATSPHERLYLSFYLYRTSAYQAANPGLRAGGIRGSTTQYGSFGVGYGTPGSCADDPNNVNRQEFMFAYVANQGSTWALRTYTNWLGVRKLSEDPPTCGGAFANEPDNTPRATYHDSNFVPSVNAWHRYEIEVRLNDVGQSNGWQRIWVDGVLKIEHLNVMYRTTSDMKLWGVTFDTGDISGGELYVDDVLVTTARPQ